MQLAIDEAELARGGTGDNPWVGCVIANARGQVIARGHTQGPGEDHAEIAAIRQAKAHGIEVAGAVLYSTLEPCAFHGRTPACARTIADHKLGLVVTGMRDPHPKVNGAGAQILRDAGIEVIEGVGEAQIRQQLGTWVFKYHPHEPRRRAQALLAQSTEAEVLALLCELYRVPEAVARMAL